MLTVLKHKHFSAHDGNTGDETRETGSTGFYLNLVFFFLFNTFHLFCVCLVHTSFSQPQVSHRCVTGSGAPGEHVPAAVLTLHLVLVLVDHRCDSVHVRAAFKVLVLW